MSKLKGIRDMSAETVKKDGEEATPVIKVKRVRSKRKIHRAGYGSFKPTVIMQDVAGAFVKVKREDVLKQIDVGWKPVNRKTYREAVRGGATAAASVAKVSKKRK